MVLILVAMVKTLISGSLDKPSKIWGVNWLEEGRSYKGKKEEGRGNNKYFSLRAREILFLL
jgi:hypothetical protein